MHCWFCINTKPRKEDEVCRMFEYVPSIEVFNPKLKKPRVKKGKTREVIEHLFPSYLFMKLSMDDHYRMVKYTRGVRSFVGDKSGNPYVVDNRVIDIIKSRLKDGYVAIEPPRFEEGEDVLIKEGPFAGLRGIFLGEKKAQDRVFILLNTFEFQAKIEINKYLLSKT